MGLNVDYRLERNELRSKIQTSLSLPDQAIIIGSSATALPTIVINAPVKLIYIDGEIEGGTSEETLFKCDQDAEILGYNVMCTAADQATDSAEFLVYIDGKLSSNVGCTGLSKNCFERNLLGMFLPAGAILKLLFAGNNDALFSGQLYYRSRGDLIGQ